MAAAKNIADKLLVTITNASQHAYLNRKLHNHTATTMITIVTIIHFLFFIFQASTSSSSFAFTNCSLS